MGVALGIVIAAWPLLSRIVYPLLVSSQSIPKVALAPLLVIWFGFDMTPKILMSARAFGDACAEVRAFLMREGAFHRAGWEPLA